MAPHDVEHQKKNESKELLEGYVELAEFIESDAQLSIWRRYDTLAARNLLYLEAELQLIQFKLQKLDREDLKIIRNSTGDVKASTDAAGRCWEVFYSRLRMATQEQRKDEP